MFDLLKHLDNNQVTRVIHWNMMHLPNNLDKSELEHLALIDFKRTLKGFVVDEIRFDKRDETTNICSFWIAVLVK